MPEGEPTSNQGPKSLNDFPRLEGLALTRLMGFPNDWTENVTQYYPDIEQDKQWEQQILRPGALACFILGDFVLRRTPEVFRSPSTERVIDIVVGFATKAEQIVGIRAKEEDLVTLFDLMSKFSAAERRLSLEPGDLEHLIQEAVNELTQHVREALSS